MVCECACVSVRVRVVSVCTRCDSCTREVQACVGAFLSSASRLRQGAEQGADGVQRVAHPPLQVSGGGVAFMEQLWDNGEQNEFKYSRPNHLAVQQTLLCYSRTFKGEKARSLGWRPPKYCKGGRSHALCPVSLWRCFTKGN